MKLASIDIGSNTVLLLLAELDENLNIIKEENFYEMPRISQGLSESKRSITSDKIELLLKILRSYKEKVKIFGAEKVIVNATNAFRIADNSEEIKEIIKSELDWEINIISGEEEARLSFLGAASVINDSKDKLVIDIGGGSTELIFGNNEELKYKKSFQIGVVSLTEKFFFVDNSTYLNPAINELNKIFDFDNNLPKEIPTIAVAGTPTSLVCMINNIKEYSNDFVEGNKISKTELEEIINRMKNMTSTEIQNEFGEVVNGRNDVIFSGSIILNFIMDKLNLSEIIVSAKGLRYGAVIDYAKRNV